MVIARWLGPELVLFDLFLPGNEKLITKLLLKIN